MIKKLLPILVLVVLISLSTVSATDIDATPLNPDVLTTSDITIDNDTYSSLAQDNAKYVSADGNDENNDGSEKNPYCTITRALQDDVSVIYIIGKINITDSVSIDKTVTINGINATINGLKTEPAFYVKADDITITNINFIDCYDDYGGAIYWEGVNGTVTNCTFTNCKAKSSHGGAIYWEGVNGTVTNCTFNSCSAYGFGGGVYWHADNGAVSDCTFTSCSASDNGGAICWFRVNNGAVSDCTFTSCSASNNGGAIYWYGDDINGNLSDCTFTSCSATDGGAIYWYGINGNVTTCSFNSCSASSNGGAISWNGNYGSVSACTFAKCSSKSYGGAIYWIADNGAVSDCNFSNCSSNSGGAVSWFKSNNCNMTGCTFNSCSAIRNGGAIYWYGVDGDVTACIFTNCNGIKGTAIYITSNGYLAITDSTCTPIDNKAPIYNDGAILSEVVITTMNGTDKEISTGESVNLTATMTTSNIAITGGTMKFTVNDKDIQGNSDDYGVYSAEYTPDFTGTKAVNANYNGATGTQSLNAFNLRVNSKIPANDNDTDVDVNTSDKKHNYVDSKTKFNIDKKIVSENTPLTSMPNTGNPLLVLLIALASIGIGSLRRKQ